MKFLLESLTDSIFKKEDNEEILYVIPLDIPDFKITFYKEKNLLKIEANYEKEEKDETSQKCVKLNLEYTLKLPPNITEENIKALKEDNKLLIYIKK